MFAGGQAHAVALLPCPEVLAVQVKGGGIVDVPDVARAEMQAIVGRTAVVVRLASGCVAQIRAVVLVVRLARASAGFGVEAARPNIDEVHAGQNAAAQIVGIAVAVYGSGVREGVVGVVRAVAVFKECAQGQAARRKVDSPGQAGKQGKAVHVQMRAGVVAQRTAGQRAEPGKAVPFRVVRTGGGPHGGIHAPARHEVRALQVQGQSAEEAFGQGLGLIRGSAGADLSGDGIQPSCCRIKRYICGNVVRHSGANLYDAAAFPQIVCREHLASADFEQGQGGTGGQRGAAAQPHIVGAARDVRIAGDAQQGLRRMYRRDEIEGRVPSGKIAFVHGALAVGPIDTQDTVVQAVVVASPVEYRATV